MLPAPCSVLLLFIVFSGLVVAALGLVQRFTWNGMILWFFVPYDWGAASAGIDPRASGPFVNPDHFANYLALIFPLALGTAIHGRYFFNKELAGAVRIFAGLAAFLIFTAILLSLCRSVWIAMLPGVGLLLWLSGTGGQRTEVRGHSEESREQAARSSGHRSSVAGRGTEVRYQETGDGRLEIGRLSHSPSAIRLWAILFSLLVIASLFFVGPRGREQVDLRLGETVTQDAGLWGRTAVWSDTVKMIRDFPLAGVGLGSWQDLFQRYQSPPWLGSFYREAHNDYIELLAETGIIGVVLLAWFFWLAARRLWTYLQSSAEPGSRALVAMVCAALAIMAFHEVFDFSLQIPANAFLFTVLLALGLRLARGQRSEDGSQRLETGDWRLGDPQFEIRNSKSKIRATPLALSLRFLCFCCGQR